MSVAGLTELFFTVGSSGGTALPSSILLFNFFTLLLST
jgi:hypothetical protein